LSGHGRVKRILAPLLPNILLGAQTLLLDAQLFYFGNGFIQRLPLKLQVVDVTLGRFGGFLDGVEVRGFGLGI
jgi:hypothetical protein